MPRPAARTLKIKLAQIDREALPPAARTPGTSAFQTEVSRLVRRNFAQLGGAIEALAWTPAELTVTWQPPDPSRRTLAPVIALLERGEHREAALILELLLSGEPDDADLLYNLGMAYSDLGRLDRAAELLRRLVSLNPEHVNARVALGVAFTRQRKFAEAETELREAVRLEPNNPWAHRNLGATLLNLAEPGEAVQHLRRATELNPVDERAWLGLGKALEAVGDVSGADAAYRRVVEIDPDGQGGEQAKDALRRIGSETFRGAGTLRMDAVMYLVAALEKFAKLPADEVRKIGFEIGLLATRGLEVNDPSVKYRLRSLAGEFTGLQLVCLQYAAFKQIEPGLDIGFDLAREYEMARGLSEGRGNSQ